MSDEQSLRVALALVERGILTPKAARFLSHFATTRLLCAALQALNGTVDIFWRERIYTPAEFNAMVDGRYPPTPDDVVASIRALALAADADADADVAAPKPAAEPEPTSDPAPTPTPAPDSPEADAELERLHQAASQRPGGAGALTVGLLALLFWAAVAFAALGFWHVVELFWPR